jgi:hypothetical protein
MTFTKTQLVVSQDRDALLAKMEAASASRPKQMPQTDWTPIFTANALMGADFDEYERGEAYAALSVMGQTLYVNDIRHWARESVGTFFI